MVPPNGAAPGGGGARGLPPLHDVQQTGHLRVVQRVVSRGGGAGDRVRGGHRLGRPCAGRSAAWLGTGPDPRHGPQLVGVPRGAAAVVFSGRPVPAGAARPRLAPPRQARALDGPPVAAERHRDRPAADDARERRIARGPRRRTRKPSAPADQPRPPAAQPAHAPRAERRRQTSARYRSCARSAVTRHHSEFAALAHFPLVALEFGRENLVGERRRRARLFLQRFFVATFFATANAGGNSAPRAPASRWLRPVPTDVVGESSRNAPSSSPSAVLLLRRRDIGGSARQPGDASRRPSASGSRRAARSAKRSSRAA